MAEGYQVGGYTLEEMQAWFLDSSKHNKKMVSPMNADLGWGVNPLTPNQSGIFMNHHNTVIVMDKFVLHNDAGPAKVMFTKEGKPFYSLFARKGVIIPWDDFEAKIRTAQVKRIEKEINDANESNESNEDSRRTGTDPI